MHTMIQTPRALGFGAFLLLVFVVHWFYNSSLEGMKLGLCPAPENDNLVTAGEDVCPESCLGKNLEREKILEVQQLCSGISNLKTGDTNENTGVEDNGGEEAGEQSINTAQRVNISEEQASQAMGGPSNYSLGVLDGNLSDVMNETLGFQKILLVNLPERHDKLDAQIVSSSITGFEFEVIAGIRGKDVSEATLPPTFDPKTINEGVQTIGAWRAELNAVRTIIRERLSSALIMVEIEDDSDWDLHLKYQLLDVARGNRFLSRPKDNPSAEFTEDEPTTGKDSASSPTHSPYGANWDIIWLGHCGSHSDPDTRRFVLRNDPTVPRESDIHVPAGSPEPASLWKESGTRIMYKSGHGVCSWTYGVSFVGAQKLVNAMSIEPFNQGFDQGLGRLCSSGILRCTHIFPPIFGAHAPAGGANRESDITGHRAGTETREKGRTHNVLWSTRLNIKNILEGKEVEAQWDGIPDLKDGMKREFVM